MTILGVDVSHWQGVMDWDKAKAKGVQFAIIKAAEGTTWRDDQFNRNVWECKRLGIKWGAYFYFYPQYDAVAQANNFIDAMMGYAPDLGIWGDFEQPATGIDVGPRAQIFMNNIKTFYSAGIYTSPGYAKYTLKNAAWMKEFPLWIANYGYTDDAGVYHDAVAPSIPLPWTEAVIWQYSSKGVGYGSEGYIDLNKFMRPDSEWAAFSGVTDEPVVTPPIPEPIPEVKPTFADVPETYWAHDWIEEFVKRGLTTGAGKDAQGNLYYLPERPVTRAEIAVFILRSLGWKPE